MGQAIYQGRTNNHLNWVMVDSTDFATPESALSAATKIKIYGQLRSATGTNFVSSGTGSLTNDITHVGASALGIYHIALAKADISDASAAFYDTYIVTLSATGAAYQTLIVEGIKDDGSYVSNVLSYLSNMASNLSGIQSDIYSNLVVNASKVLLIQSAASDAASAAVQANSRVLLTQSLASDAASAAIQANSRVLLNKSAISDIQSYLVAMSGVQSDIYSCVSDMQSDFQSRVPKLVATNSQVSDLVSDLASDLKSYLGVMSGVQSDIYSVVTTARGEPGQGAPGVSTDPFTKIDYLYKFLRNKITQDATTLKVYADDAATVDHKATVSDDGTTYTRGEIATGP